MSRRRSAAVNRFVDGQRASIGDYYVDTAVTNLNKACQAECAMFVETIKRDDLIAMIIPDHIADLLRAARPYAAAPALLQDYDLQPLAPCALHVNYSGLNILPADNSCVKANVERWQPLRDRIQTITALRHKWGAVVHVLRWCNRNLTPGAIRNIWPSAMTLCPGSPAMQELKREAPVRYDSPKDLGTMLPLVRYTAGTVAALAMLPSDVTLRGREGVWLTYSSADAIVEGCTVSLDSGAYNIG